MNISNNLVSITLILNLIKSYFILKIGTIFFFIELIFNFYIISIYIYILNILIIN